MEIKDQEGRIILVGTVEDWRKSVMERRARGELPAISKRRYKNAKRKYRKREALRKAGEMLNHQQLTLWP